MKKLFLITVLFLGNYVYGQSPNWSVNASSYQYTMTMTAFLNVNGTTLTNPEDKIGAFVNNENRGEAKVVFNAKAKKYVAYLTLYSNTHNETINFKIYDSQNNKIIPVTKTAKFSIDGNLGGVFQSYSIASPALNTNTEITSFSFKGIVGNAIISGDKISFEVPETTALTGLIPEFTTTNNGGVYLEKVQQTSGTNTVDFSNPVVYEVLSEDESEVKTYTVTVSKKVKEQPITVVLSSSSLLSNTQPATVRLKASEAIFSLSADDFVLENGIVSGLTSANNTTFTLEVVSLSEGNFSITLPENKVRSITNQPNKASNKLGLFLDSTAPFVKSITRQSPNAEFTHGASVTFEVRFSENVVKVNSADFSSVSGSNISVSQVRGLLYEVTVSNLTNYSGVVPLALSPMVNIEDVAGNKLQTSKIVSYEK